MKKTMIILAAIVLAAGAVRAGDITHRFRLVLPQIPVKHTYEICTDGTCLPEQWFTPTFQPLITATISDSLFTLVRHRIWWYDSTEAPTTHYQTYCPARPVNNDSTLWSMVFSFGGVTVSDASIRWYRDDSLYFRDIFGAVDSIYGSQYIVDTAYNLIRALIYWEDETYGQDEIEICPAYPPATDTIYDTLTVDTLSDTVYVAGIMGAGPNDYTIYVRDTATGTMLSNAWVGLWTTGGDWWGAMYTDGSGAAYFKTRLEDYEVHVYKSGYFSTNTTNTVSANGQVDTFAVRTATVPATSPPDMAVVSLTIWSGPQRLAGAVVELSNLNSAVDSTRSIMLAPYYSWGVTDSYGQIQLWLPKSYIFADSLQGLYDFVVSVDGTTIATLSDVHIPNVDTVSIIANGNDWSYVE